MAEFIDPNPITPHDDPPPENDDTIWPELQDAGGLIQDENGHEEADT